MMTLITLKSFHNRKTFDYFLMNILFMRMYLYLNALILFNSPTRVVFYFRKETS